MDAGEAERRFAARLEEAGLPGFVSAVHERSSWTRSTPTDGP